MRKTLSLVGVAVALSACALPITGDTTDLPRSSAVCQEGVREVFVGDRFEIRRLPEAGATDMARFVISFSRSWMPDEVRAEDTDPREWGTTGVVRMREGETIRLESTGDAAIMLAVTLTRLGDPGRDIADLVRIGVYQTLSSATKKRSEASLTVTDGAVYENGILRKIAHPSECEDVLKDAPVTGVNVESLARPDAATGEVPLAVVSEDRAEEADVSSIPLLEKVQSEPATEPAPTALVPQGVQVTEEDGFAPIRALERMLGAMTGGTVTATAASPEVPPVEPLTAKEPTFGPADLPETITGEVEDAAGAPAETAAHQSVPDEAEEVVREQLQGQKEAMTEETGPVAEDMSSTNALADVETPEPAQQPALQEVDEASPVVEEAVDPRSLLLVPPRTPGAGRVIVPTH